MAESKGQMITVRPPKNPQPGQRVGRMLGGIFFMQMEIAAVTDTEIGCWPVETSGRVLRSGNMMYRFDRRTGAELDADLGWGPPTEEDPDAWTGSYIEEIESGESSGVDVQGREKVPGRTCCPERGLKRCEPPKGQRVDQLQRTDKVPDDPLE